MNDLLINLQKPLHFSIYKCLKVAWDEFISDYKKYITITLIALTLQFLVPFIAKLIFAHEITFFNISIDIGNKIIMTLLFMFIITPTLLSTSICYHQKKITGYLSIKNFFLGYKKVVQLFLCQISIIAIAICISFPLFIVDAILNPERTASETLFDNMSMPMMVMSLITFIMLIYINISFTFASYFCYFYNLNAKNALIMSYKYVKKSWMHFFALYIIYAIIMYLGFSFIKLGNAFMFLGLVLSTPLVCLASYNAFVQLTNLDDALQLPASTKPNNNF